MPTAASWICHFGSLLRSVRSVPRPEFEFDKTFYKLIYVLNMLPAQRLSQLDFAGKCGEKFSFLSPPGGPHQSSIMSMGRPSPSLFGLLETFFLVFINKAFVFPVMSSDRRLSRVAKTLPQGMDGIWACRSLRRHKKWQHFVKLLLPIFYFSSSAFRFGRD